MIIFGLEICPYLIKNILLYAFIGGVTVFVCLKYYLFTTCGIFENKFKMNNKVVIVTGATSGIGKETAKNLAQRGAKVILACRNVESANNVKDELIASTNNSKIIVKKLDVSSLKSVREFAADINKTEPELHILIHNAGTAETKKKITEDGLELTMATNHFGPFLLTHLLIDLLKKSGPSRIIVVASELYRLACVNLEKLNPTNTFFQPYIYYVSKYVNIYFTRELARRLEGSQVTVNCLHPGMIDSGIWRNVPFPLNWPVKLIAKSFFKNSEQGCQTTVFLAVSEDVEGVSGKYFMDCRERGLSAKASDMEKAQKVWELSAELVALKDTDPKI